MKNLKALSLTLALILLPPYYVQASVGKDMAGGIASGTISLGSLYIAKDQKQITEQQALAIAALTGLVTTAVLQARNEESSLIDAGVHIATAVATFGLLRYLVDGYVPAATADASAQGTAGAE